MGTINYGTSKYITLGLEPFAFSDYEDEPGECDYFSRSYDMEDLQRDAEQILECYNFKFFDVSIISGYYEGFYIDISDVSPFLFDESDLPEAFREANCLGALLLRFIKLGLAQCFPGWCTGYASAEESKKAVAAAVCTMKKSFYDYIDYFEYDNSHRITRKAGKQINIRLSA